MPERPAQGVFGGIRPDESAPTRLDFDVSLIGAYDDDVPADVQSIVDPTGLQNGGYSTIVNAKATYNWNGNRTQFGAAASSTVRHYAELGETQSVGHGVGVGVTTRLPWRMTLFVNQSASYSPAYFYSVFPAGPTDIPGFADTTNPDFAVNNGLESYTYMTQVRLGRDLTQRDTLSFTGQYDYSDRVARRELPLNLMQWNDVSSFLVLGQYTRRVSANTNLSGEARYRSGDYGYGFEGKSTEAGLQFGVNHTKVLSATRRAAIRLNVGVSGTDLPGNIIGDQSIVGDESLLDDIAFTRQYRGVGDVGFAYQFGRTWQTALNFQRGVEYLPEFPRPVFTDGVTLSGDGLLSRRVDISARASYSDGASAFNSNSLQFTTYGGNVRVRYAWNRILATYGEYLYYYYHFRNRTVLQPDIPSSLERNGVRVGLTLWVPAIRR